MAATVRSSNTVARLGGDEFLLLLQEIHDLQDATTIADKILYAFKEPFPIQGRNLYLSASMGIAIARMMERPGSPDEKIGCFHVIIPSVTEAASTGYIPLAIV